MDTHAHTHKHTEVTQRHKVAVFVAAMKPSISQLPEVGWGGIMTFENNITKANCCDYHNDYHY